MSLCFIDPADAIRAIADSVGREARRQLLGEAVRAWVDEIPDDELEAHYARAISELDEHDISMLAAWHASMDVGHPLPNRDFLMGAFGSLGEHRREALKLAAGFRGEEAVDRGVTEERALDTVLDWLSPAAPDGAGRRGGRALRLGPRGLRQLASSDQRRLDLRDRLVVVAEVDGAHAELAGGVDVTSMSSTNRQSDAVRSVSPSRSRRRSSVSS